MADEKSWKPLDLVKVSAEYLAGRGVPNPRLDAEILLCDVLGLPRRVDLYAGFERTVSGRELGAYRELIRRRAAREPVSRILGKREFMGIGFTVTPDVLSPRPETEMLVEAVIETLRPRPPQPDPSLEEPRAAALSPTDDPEAEEGMTPELESILDQYAEDAEDDGEDAPVVSAARPARQAPPAPERPAVRKRAAAPMAGEAGPAVRILDLGTGSGCIAIAIAAHLPGVTVVAVDASPKALAVARKNAARAGVADRVEFRQGDWFAACRAGERFHIIVSNPPYLVEGDEAIWPEVSRYDPPAALYGGRDGLDCYRRIVPDASEWLERDGWIFFEVGAEQAGRVADLLRRKGYSPVDTVKDYGGVERLVRARG